MATFGQIFLPLDGEYGVWRIHHNADMPDIVIIANRDQFSSERAIACFVPTQHLQTHQK